MLFFVSYKSKINNNMGANIFQGLNWKIQLGKRKAYGYSNIEIWLPNLFHIKPYILILMFSLGKPLIHFWLIDLQYFLRLSTVPMAL